MGATYIHKGDAIDYTPSADVSAGEVVTFQDLIGVAKLDIPAGTLGSLHVVGVFRFPKPTGAGEDIAMGVKMFWDPANQVVAKAAGSGLVHLGRAVAGAGESDATVLVRLKQ